MIHTVLLSEKLTFLFEIKLFKLINELLHDGL